MNNVGTPTVSTAFEQTGDDGSVNENLERLENSLCENAIPFWDQITTNHLHAVTFQNGYAVAYQDPMAFQWNIIFSMPGNRRIHIVVDEKKWPKLETNPLRGIASILACVMGEKQHGWTVNWPSKEGITIIDSAESNPVAAPVARAS